MTSSLTPDVEDVQDQMKKVALSEPAELITMEDAVEDVEVVQHSDCAPEADTSVDPPDAPGSTSVEVNRRSPPSFAMSDERRRHLWTVLNTSPPEEIMRHARVIANALKEGEFSPAATKYQLGSEFDELREWIQHLASVEFSRID